MMNKTLLVTLKGEDQIDMVLSSLREIVDSGTSVVFSFTKSGQVTVLLPSPAEVAEPCHHNDRMNNHGVVEPTEKQKILGE